LFYCANSINTKCATELVKSKADVNHQDKDGFTPLHVAVIAGNLKLCDFLIKNGSDINLTDSEMHSVIHWAVVCGHDHFSKFCPTNPKNKTDGDRAAGGRNHSTVNATILAEQSHLFNQANTGRAQMHTTLTKKFIYYAEKLGYGRNAVLLDNCCNFSVTPLRNLLFDIRDNPNADQEINTAGGAYHVHQIGSTHDLGDIGYDRNLPMTILAYFKICKLQQVHYYQDHTGVDVYIPRINFTLSFLVKDNILVGDLSVYFRYK
jgi:hypothetical protein